MIFVLLIGVGSIRSWIVRLVDVWMKLRRVLWLHLVLYVFDEPILSMEFKYSVNKLISASLKSFFKTIPSSVF